jgi:hypothetical protein
MRTSVEISPALLKRVRALMKRRGTTLRALIEEGLERMLKDPEAEGGMQLRDAAFKGPLGFAPGVTAHDLPRLLAEMNEPRWPR